MKNLLNKEFRLALHPTNIIFISFAPMLLIPNFPYLVAFFYTGLGLFFTCITGRENNDTEYSVSLPVGRKDVVKGRIAFAVILELATLVVSVPFAIIRDFIIKGIPSNQAGSMPGLAFFALAFLLSGVFNAVFFTCYYKNPLKVGKSFVLASLAIFIVVIVDIVLSHVPVCSEVFCDTGNSRIAAKLSVFFAGIAVYIVLTAIAVVRSAKNFSKLDL